MPSAIALTAPRPARSGASDLSGHVLAIYISSGLFLGPDDTLASHNLYQTCLQATVTLDFTRSGVSSRTAELDAIHQQVGGGVGLLMPADLAKAYAIASALESGDNRLLACSTAGELGFLTQALQMGALGQSCLTGLQTSGHIANSDASHVDPIFAASSLPGHLQGPPEDVAPALTRRSRSATKTTTSLCVLFPPSMRSTSLPCVP